LKGVAHDLDSGICEKEPENCFCTRPCTTPEDFACLPKCQNEETSFVSFSEDLFPLFGPALPWTEKAEKKCFLQTENQVEEELSESLKKKTENQVEEELSESLKEKLEKKKVQTENQVDEELSESLEGKHEIENYATEIREVTFLLFRLVYLFTPLYIVDNPMQLKQVYDKEKMKEILPAVHTMSLYLSDRRIDVTEYSAQIWEEMKKYYPTDPTDDHDAFKLALAKKIAKDWEKVPALKGLLRKLSGKDMKVFTSYCDKEDEDHVAALKSFLCAPDNTVSEADVPDHAADDTGSEAEINDEGQDVKED